MFVMLIREEKLVGRVYGVPRSCITGGQHLVISQ